MNSESQPGDRLKAERLRLGMSQTALAAMCGVSREMWGRYERGGAIPGGDVLTAMGKAGVDIAYLLQGTPSSFEARLGRLARAAKIVSPMSLPKDQAAALTEQVYNALSAEEFDSREKSLIALFREASEEGKLAVEATASVFANRSLGSVERQSTVQPKYKKVKK